MPYANPANRGSRCVTTADTTVCIRGKRQYRFRDYVLVCSASQFFVLLFFTIANRAVARALIGGGGCIFIYSGPAQLVSFEIKLISKKVSRGEHEYMNIHPPPQLAF